MVNALLDALSRTQHPVKSEVAEMPPLQDLTRAMLQQTLTGGYDAATRGATMPWWPVSAIVDAMRGTGAFDERSVMEGSPLTHRTGERVMPRRPELREFVGTQEQMQAQLGGNPDSLVSLGADLAFPDLYDAARIAKAGPALLGAMGAVGRTDAVPDATRVQKILDERTPLADYENEIRFKQADTIDYNVKPRVGTTGKYKGAPAHVSTPQALGRMRFDLKRYLEDGVPGRDWYDNSAQNAGDMAEGRRDYKHLNAGITAITSRGAAVPTNQLFAVKGYNQAIMGVPVETGRFPTSQSAAIEDLAAGKLYEGGPKETPFYEGLTVDERPDNIRPTNDLWMARAFGYKKPNPKAGQKSLDEYGKEFIEPDEIVWGEGLGLAQHRFMDQEINKLVDWANQHTVGGFDDWTPERVQASVWTAVKAKSEGTTIGEAATDFSHNHDRLTGTIRYEANPAKSLDHLSGYSDSGQYRDLAMAMNSSAGGRDRLALAAGAQTLPTTAGEGVYQGVTSPSMGSRIMVAPQTKSDVIEPASANLMGLVGSGHGLVLGQETTGLTNFRPPDSAGRRNIARVPSGIVAGRSIDDLAAQLLEVFGRDAKGEAVAFPLHGTDGYEIAYTGSNGAAFKKQLDKALGVKGDAIDYGINSAPGLIGNTDFDGYKPSAWLRELDAANKGGPALGRMEGELKSYAAAMNKLDAHLVETIPDIGKRSEVLTRTRTILAEEGIEGIRKAVRAGIIPAIALSLFGAGAYTAQPPDDESA